MRATGRDPANPADTIVARPAPTELYRHRATGTTVGSGDSRRTDIYGDGANAIGISLFGTRAIVWRREKGSQRTVATVDAPAGQVDLRVTVTDGSRFQFAMSADGKTWQSIGENTQAGDLPPWDLAVRIALAVGGPRDPKASSRGFGFRRDRESEC